MDGFLPVARKYLTYRLQNIPFANASEHYIKRLFLSIDADYIKVKSLVPAIDSPEGKDGDYVATIYFYPSDITRELSIGSYFADIVDLDKDFVGFTPLHVPRNGPIAADIIAVTGLAGHAYGSWAHSPEHMWLRDYLPKDAPNARILTYGYPSQLQGSTSSSILGDHTSTFVQRLTDMREDGGCESRPIIFIGHSLGCLIIKKALTDIGSMGVNSSRLPVRAIVFLPAPHRGLHVEALQTMVKGTVTETLVDELKPNSPTLTDLNRRFSHFAKNIDILTCYETKLTKTVINVDGKWKREGPAVMMVSPDSAQQFNFKERVTSAHANHSEIAKIRKGENGLYPTIRSTIRRALVSNATIVANAEAIPSQQSAVDDETLLRVEESPTQKQKNSTENGTLSEAKESHTEAPKSAMEDETLSKTSGETEILPNSLSHDITPLIEPVSTMVPEETKNQILHEQLSLSMSVSDTPDDPQKISDSAINLDCPDKNVENSPEELAAPSIKSTLPIDEKDTDLVKALKTGDCLAVEDLAKNPNNLTEKDHDGSQPLHIAAYLGFEAGVEILLKSQVPTNERNLKDDTPLMIAVIKNHPTIVNLLLQYGANVNAIGGEFKFTPLNIAARQNSSQEIVEILLRMKADVNFKNKLGCTPLFLAVFNGHQDIAAMLLKAGADPNIGDNCGITPLMYAARNGHLKIMEILLQHGAELSARTIGKEFRAYFQEKYKKELTFALQGSSTFLFAAVGNQLEVLRFLLQKGEDVNQKSATGHTALHIAARVGFMDICRELLDNKADADCSTKLGTTPLYIAAEHNYTAVLAVLLKASSQINAKGGGYGTALHSAAFKGNIEAAKLLIEAGADLEIKYVTRPLYDAAKAGSLPVVKLLLEKGAKPGSRHAGGLWSWKNLSFDSWVTPESKKEIINLLRKYEKKR